MFLRLRSEEDGLAMVISLMVAFVILILSTVVVAQSIHTLDSSGYDRRRLTSVNAAEAGTNFYYQYFQTTPAASLSCSAITRTVGSAPATSSFTATPTYYDAATPTPNVMSCPFTEANPPAYVLVNSIGTTSSGAQRTFQSYIKLTPDYAGFDAAIVINSGTSFENNFDIYGSVGNDGDVYVLEGDLNISNTPNIRGDVFVPNGGVTMSNNNMIWGDLWARDSILLTSVAGNVYSETGDIDGGSVGGNAKAAGEIDASVAGTRSEHSVMGATPEQAFPSIGYVASDWIGAGYTPVDFTTCAAALTYIKTTWTSGSLLARIAGGSPCRLDTGNGNIALKGNLAVISDWGFDLSKTSWTSSSPASVHLISTAPAASCPASNGQATKNIVMDNQTDWASTIGGFIYTPCLADIANKTQFTGQVMGGTVSITNHFTMTYRRMTVPGVTGMTGFDQDIAYVREVV